LILNVDDKEWTPVPDTYLPADPLLARQWHLFDIGRLGFGTQNSIDGLSRIWADYTGAGVSVGIWDDGVEKTHWDLNNNYNSSLQLTILGTLNDGQPTSWNASHGTAVAGLIAAEDNGQGGVGVAFGASVTGVRVFGGADDINVHWARYLKTLDGLGNFDITNHSYGAMPDYAVYGDVAKFEASLTTGRGGLGTINVKAAGNNNVDGNGDALDSSRATITVGAVDTNGQVAYYSSFGAHLLISAPAGSVTVDRAGTVNGYNGLLSGDYTNVFGGTSAATPIVTGVVALMLDANAELGWRDVQNILAFSAMATGSLQTGNTAEEDFAWKYNGATTWNGGGAHFSEDYGYGLINAFTAVRMAEVWGVLYPDAATSANERQVKTGTISINQAIDDGATSTFTFNVAGAVDLEHVALTLNLTHSDATGLRIALISPHGTEMSVFDGSAATADTADYGLSFTFRLEGYRGESSAGDWTLKVVDVPGGGRGTLSSVGLTGYGSASSANTVYHYTDEVLATLNQPGEGGRILLSDGDGGIDWIDAASMYRDLVINLTAGATSTLAGTAFVTIDPGTVIENALGGDGNDTIQGNDADNIIGGMRGDDNLFGGGGSDTALFMGDRGDYVVVAADGTITVTSVGGGYGTDVLIGFEFARFDNVTLDLVAILNDGTAPLLISVTPADDATLVDPGSNIVLTFDETVLAGHGAFVIHHQDGSVWSSIDATDTTQVTFADNQVTLNPTHFLDGLTDFYIVVEAGAVTDIASNDFAGFGSPTETRFTTDKFYNLVEGNSRAQKLGGTGLDDRIYGYGGNDTLYGRGGNDFLNGGSGRDAMAGGSGDDIYVVDNKYDTVTEAVSAGHDTIQTARLAWALGSNIEDLIFTGVGDFRGKGNAAGNQITGGDGNDILSGLGGADTLQGGLGDDRLRGGTGRDFLTGGAGADHFVFASANEVGIGSRGDVITDFETGIDVIDLSVIDAKSGRNNQAFSSTFVSDFTHQKGQLMIEQTLDGVDVSGDINGDGIADFTLHVLGVSLLQADDFIL
jgi:subtilisin-like proprotein convertase family protein